MTEPSSPALIAIWRAGQLSALHTISTPVFWSSFCTRSFFRTSVARSIGAIRRIMTACRRARLALLTVSRRMRRHDWAQRTKRMSLRL
jgi:hypothetical protein